MRFRTFLWADVIGGVVWGAGYILLGELAGTEWTRSHNIMGRVGLAALSTAALTAVFFIRRRRRRGDRGPSHT